jgi:hypothetical protein
MVDLTGGVTEKFNLTQTPTDDAFWRFLKQEVDSQALVVCAFT